MSSGLYDAELVQGELAVGVSGVEPGEEVPLGRDDSLKVLAASNTILALVLVGVLVLQAGQWYAERKEGQEMDRMERERGAERAERGGRGAGAQRGGAGKKKVG